MLKIKISVSIAKFDFFGFFSFFWNPFENGDLWTDKAKTYHKLIYFQHLKISNSIIQLDTYGKLS